MKTQTDGKNLFTAIEADTGLNICVEYERERQNVLKSEFKESADIILGFSRRSPANSDEEILKLKLKAVEFEVQLEQSQELLCLKNK
jgi:hypothetical protein